MTELDRQAALNKTALLDSLPEERFDRLTRLASVALRADVALISLIDADRQWFKSRHGLEASETPRDQAFCSHTIMSNEIMVVPDATKDPRFSENPLVTSDPHVSFYAGAPLITKDGHALGTLCIFDRKPRHSFGDDEKQTLADIAETVMFEIEAGAQEQIIKDLNLVNEELQHRMGNMYAHVSSLISMMSRAGGNQKDFVRRLRDRISVLAETQALIASNKFQSAPLSAIFDSTLAPFLTDKNRHRVKFVADRDIDVSARGAFTMTLMLNELATNALKHGALKGDDGKIEFSWANDEDDMIRFDWKEISPGVMEAPGEHQGFGSQILSRIVPMDFQGEVENNFLPEGLHYRVSARHDRVDNVEDAAIT